MPFVHIKSLPFKPVFEVDKVVEAISKDFAKGTELELEYVSVSWAFFPVGGYAVEGIAKAYQPKESHPLLVDILSPDFNPQAQVERMCRVVAESIEKHTGIPHYNIFINHRQAHSGMVFDAGEMVWW